MSRIADRDILLSNIEEFIGTLSTLRGALGSGYLGAHDGAKSLAYIAKDMTFTASAILELSKKLNRPEEHTQDGSAREKGNK